MEKSTGPSKAFALKSQYVPMVRKAAQEAGVAPSDDEDGDLGPVETNSKKRKLDGDGKEGQVAENQPVWEYNKHRKAFIKNAMNAENVSYAKAQEMWNSSDEKYDLLGCVSISELKKRRFIPKGCFENPWATKSNPK